MSRWLPYPLITASLFLMWLLLTQSFSPGQIVLGVIVSVLAAWGMAALGHVPARISSWTKVVELAWFVTLDIIRSNLAVAKIVLSPSMERNSSFIRLRLDLRDHHALAILGLIITATPGTAWVQYDSSSRILMIHVLDLVDEEAWVDLLKSRYERLLMEIFEQ